LCSYIGNVTYGNPSAIRRLSQPPSAWSMGGHREWVPKDRCPWRLRVPVPGTCASYDMCAYYECVRR
jgi:hypothetical protein